MIALIDEGLDPNSVRLTDIRCPTCKEKVYAYDDRDWYLCTLCWEDIPLTAIRVRQATQP